MKKIENLPSFEGTIGSTNVVIKDTSHGVCVKLDVDVHSGWQSFFCKYGDEDCIVVNGILEPEYPCNCEWM